MGDGDQDKKSCKAIDEAFDKDSACQVQQMHTNKIDDTSEGASCFDHWSSTASVGTSKPNQGLLGAFIAGAILIFIVIMMLSNGHHVKIQQPGEPKMAVSNDLTFQQNERRLTELRNQANKSVQVPQFSIEDDNQDSKAMVARRNAPTQMYSSAMTKSQNIKTSSKGSHYRQMGQVVNIATAMGIKKIEHPRFTIAEGEFVHATLETAINSDLPGWVRAVITRPVYAYVGERPIIPAGSRLIGQYAALSSNHAATVRAFIIWHRIITPSGLSIMINSPSIDELGRVGIRADTVDTHFWTVFGEASLLSVVGATTANADVGNYDQPNSADRYRQSIASAFQQSAQNSLRQNQTIKPTLYIHQGNTINVFVAHDLDLYNVLEHES